LSKKESVMYVKEQSLLKYAAWYIYLTYSYLVSLGVILSLLLALLSALNGPQEHYIYLFLSYGAPIVFLCILHIYTRGIYRCKKCHEFIFAYKTNFLGDAKFIKLPRQILFKKRFTCPYCHQKFTLIKSEAMPPVED
jgi:hypothetical protein